MFDIYIYIYVFEQAETFDRHLRFSNYVGHYCLFQDSSLII